MTAYTASTALLEAFAETGVSCIFANFGSDHPALLEAIADAKARGVALPKIITAPVEMVGLCAAQGHAQVSGQAQAVIVHVDCGTQSLAGAVHNVAKGRAPVMIFAGLSPFTQEGELTGSRNEFIQWIQDVPDQRGIVRQYMKYDNELRTAANVKQIVRRAMQVAHSAPMGPVYLVGGREVMEAEATPVALDPAHWRPVGAGALTDADARTLLDALRGARRPLIVTSYLGRNPDAVAPLVRLCDRLGIGLLESVPSAVNFPHDHPMYQGNHWNHPFQNEALADADVVLVIDSDVPWIPTVSRPAPDARVFHIDVDPLKDDTPLFYIPAQGRWRADARTALDQLNALLDALLNGDDDQDSKARRDHYAARHAARARVLSEREAKGADLTVEYLLSRLRPHLADAIVMNEGITNYPQICDHLAPTRPGSMFASGGGSLGWSGGAAIGAKLAAPDRFVAAVTGDGCYMFSTPSTVFWMARRYDTPFLQVVLNNGGWNAPRHSARSVHPHGYAASQADIDIGFDPAPAYADIAAAAGGAFARVISTADEVEDALAEAVAVVGDQRRCAVLDVRLPRR